MPERLLQLGALRPAVPTQPGVSRSVPRAVTWVVRYHPRTAVARGDLFRSPCWVCGLGVQYGNEALGVWVMAIGLLFPCTVMRSSGGVACFALGGTRT